MAVPYIIDNININATGVYAEFKDMYLCMYVHH